MVFFSIRAGSQVAASVDWLSSTCSDDERTKVCRRLFGVAREAYGATALALSGGGALGLYHFRVVRAVTATPLTRSDLRHVRRAYRGASFCCCRNDSELRATCMTILRYRTT